MNDEYIAYPLTIFDLAQELKKICDDYKARKIDNTKFVELINWYAEKMPEKLFDGEEFNITILRIVGIRRMKILNILLPNNKNNE